MKVVIQENCEKLYDWTASRIKDAIVNHKGEKPFVLGISLSKETAKVLEKLVEFYEKAELSFQNVRVLLTEEYGCMPEYDPNNNLSSLKRVFLDKVDVKNINIVSFSSNPKESEPNTIQNCITLFGGIDILVCDLGINGRLLLNEPFSSFKSRCRMVILTKVTYDTIAPNFPTPPKMGCTLGIADILDSREVIVLASKKEMAMAVKTTVEGPVAMKWPASSLAFHKNAILAINQDAASKLGAENRRFFLGFSTIEL